MKNSHHSRVGLMTFHYQYNCGSALQAYALQEMINKLGYECLIINYFFRDDMKIYGVRWGSPLKAVIFDILITPKRFFQHQKYKEFRKRFFTNLTTKTDDPNALASMSENCDILVCGSDQIWNFDLGDVSPYFLNFASSGQKKISYAPSYNKDELDEKAKNAYKKYLRGFASISVREQSTATQLANILNKRIECVLDPTLLHSKTFYTDMLQGYRDIHFPDRYIFVYNLHLSRIKKLLKFAEEYAEKNNIKIVYFAKRNILGRLYEKNIFKYGPLAFLRAISGADFVIGDSYHACAFSIIFGKQFICGYENTRTMDLLKKFNLENRFIDNDINLNEKINYKEVNLLLDEYKSISINYLIQSLKTGDRSQ